MTSLLDIPITELELSLGLFSDVVCEMLTPDLKPCCDRRATWAITISCEYNSPVRTRFYCTECKDIILFAPLTCIYECNGESHQVVLLNVTKIR